MRKLLTSLGNTFYVKQTVQLLIWRSEYTFRTYPRSKERLFPQVKLSQ